MEYQRWDDPRQVALRAKYEDKELTERLKAIVRAAVQAYDHAFEETIDIPLVLVEDQPKLLKE